MKEKPQHEEEDERQAASGITPYLGREQTPFGWKTLVLRTVPPSAQSWRQGPGRRQYGPGIIHSLRSPLVCQDSPILPDPDDLLILVYLRQRDAGLRS